jgi:hypothetical protein
VLLPQRILRRPLPAGPGQEGQWLPAARSGKEAAAALLMDMTNRMVAAVVNDLGDNDSLGLE